MNFSSPSGLFYIAINAISYYNMGKKGVVVVKKKRLGYMHWLPGLLLAALLDGIFNIITNTWLPEFIYYNVPFNARIHCMLIITTIFPLIVDALWYTLTSRRYSQSTKYFAYCIFRIIWRILQYAELLLAAYEATGSRGILGGYSVVRLAVFVLLFVAFEKKYSNVASEEQAADGNTQ